MSIDFPQIKNDAATSEAYMTTLMYSGFWAADQVTTTG